MKKFFKTMLALLSGSAMILSVAACGSSNSGYKSESTWDSGYDYDEYEEIAYPEEMPETSASMPDIGDVAPDASSNNFVIESTEKLIYTCNMSMETLDFQNTVDTLKALVTKYQGFIQSENQTDNSNDWYYTTYEKTTGSLTEYITVRIPTKNYDAFLNELEGNGKVTSKNQTVENITQSYYDVQTTIKSLRTQEDRLLEMLDSCNTIEEMITVEARLAEVQNELSIYQNRLNTMDADLAYSTVSITVKEVVKYDPVIKTDTFGDRLLNTITDSIATFLSFLEGLLFFLIYALPIVTVVGGISLGIFFIIRAIVRKNIKKRREKAVKEQP